MTQIEQRIAKAEEALKTAQEKLKQAKALKQKQEAKKRAALAKAERSADTRRKVLIGSLILAKVERGEWPRESMMAMLDKGLTRDHDRELFGLSVQPQKMQDSNDTAVPETSDVA